MNFLNQTISGVVEIVLEPTRDERGFFGRSYDKQIFERVGIDSEWVQENHSLTLKKNTIRGLHLQLPPHTESKLIRVIRGRIVDVFVDLRKDSATYGKHGKVILSAEKMNMVYLPRGLAHGFWSLSDGVEMIYKVDNYYEPKAEIGLRWNDPGLKIKWPEGMPQLSEKDKAWPNLSISKLMI